MDNDFFTESESLISFLKLFQSFGNDTAGKYSRCFVLGILISNFFDLCTKALATYKI